MALNSSGPISLAGTTAGQSIQIELGGNGSTRTSLNDTNVRTLAGVSSGQITMPTNFWGKSNRVQANISITTNTDGLNLVPNNIPGYVAGKTDIVVTINSGVYVWQSSSSSLPTALWVGFFATGDTIKIINYGYIIGLGGNGGNGLIAFANSSTPGQNGRNAIFVGTSCTIDNQGYIAGGGGGGGAAATYFGAPTASYGGGGGGAGGGNGGSSQYGVPGNNPQVTYAGATGGAPGQKGNDGPDSLGYSSGGGGRILPGDGGAAGKGGGAGGGGAGSQFSSLERGGVGGAAGNAGASTTSSNPQGGGGGGGWGAAGGAAVGFYTKAGGAGGKAISLNGTTVTWINTGTIYGAVS